MYGLGDSGRLWYLTSDEALIQSFGIAKSKIEPSLYFKLDATGNLCLTLVFQVDNYVYTGTQEQLDLFEGCLQSEFKVGELHRRSFEVYGCELKQFDDYSIQLTQKNKMKELLSLEIPVCA